MKLEVIFRTSNFSVFDFRKWNLLISKTNKRKEFWKERKTVKFLFTNALELINKSPMVQKFDLSPLIQLFTYSAIGKSIFEIDRRKLHDIVSLEFIVFSRFWSNNLRRQCTHFQLEYFGNFIFLESLHIMCMKRFQF